MGGRGAGARTESRSLLMNTLVETSSFGEGVQVFYGERGIEQFIYTNSESSVHILSVGVSFYIKKYV